jgi:hypothetical protein
MPYSPNSRQVAPNEGEELAKLNNAAWVETSAKNNVNVGKALSQFSIHIFLTRPYHRQGLRAMSCGDWEAITVQQNRSARSKQVSHYVIDATRLSLVTCCPAFRLPSLLSYPEPLVSLCTSISLRSLGVLHFIRFFFHRIRLFLYNPLHWSMSRCDLYSV